MIAALLLLMGWGAHAFDRPQPLPDPLEPPAIAEVELQRGTLSNGLEVVVVPDHRAPLFELRLVAASPNRIDPVGQEGLASAMFHLLTAGTPSRDADEISAAARQLGIQLRGSVQINGGSFVARGLSRNLEPAVALWAESLTEPIFPEAELQTWKRAEHDTLANREANPTHIAQRVWWKLTYGDGALGRAPTHASLGSLQREALIEAHRTHLGPGRSVVLLGGDVTLAQAIPLLEKHLGGWTSAASPPSLPSPMREPEGPVLYVIDHPGASQTQVRTGTPLPPRILSEPTGVSRVHPDTFPLLVANHAFAGAFTSRVNLNLREDKGYTYGARCRIVPAPDESWLQCYTSVHTQVTGPALAELQAELDGLRGDRPLSAEEIDLSRRALARRWPTTVETVSARLDREQEIWHNDLPSDWITGYVERVTAVDTEGANRAVRGVISPQRTFWLIVGDYAAFQEALQPLGARIVHLDAQGRIQPTVKEQPTAK